MFQVQKLYFRIELTFAAKASPGERQDCLLNVEPQEFHEENPVSPKTWGPINIQPEQRNAGGTIATHW